MLRRGGRPTSRGLGGGPPVGRGGTFGGRGARGKTASGVGAFIPLGTPGRKGIAESEAATTRRLDPKGASAFAGARARRSLIGRFYAMGPTGTRRAFPLIRAFVKTPTVGPGS